MDIENVTMETVTEIQQDARAKERLAEEIKERVRTEARKKLSEFFGTPIPDMSLLDRMVSILCREQAKLCFVLCDLIGATADMRRIAKAKTPAEVTRIFDQCVRVRREAK